MQERFIEESVAVLTRTPTAFDALLRGMPEAWTTATEGPGTWSPYDVIGHLVHCEKTDWMPRLTIILEHGPNRTFDPLDREAQFQESNEQSLDSLLDEFGAWRRDSLARLLALNLRPVQLELTGTHPALGTVTLRQLLAAWVAHDMTHIAQVVRVMAKRYKQAVGPWTAYLSVLK